MNRNHLKIIACASMLADHIGYFLFPQLEVLRWIGKIAFPLFAFFIGEGCVYTSSRKKYHLSVFLLGVGCQLVYIIEDLIRNGKITFSSDCLFLNILLTFSLGIFACFTMCDIREAYNKKDKKAVFADTGFGQTGNRRHPRDDRDKCGFGRSRVSPNARRYDAKSAGEKGTAHLHTYCHQRIKIIPEKSKKDTLTATSLSGCPERIFRTSCRAWGCKLPAASVQMLQRQPYAQWLPQQLRHRP